MQKYVILMQISEGHAILAHQISNYWTILLSNERFTR